ncbi:sigma-70 family RNA polymerase sigma factor [Fulvivirgaceae bacterium BMA12]|uniref:Sigma-70 family RNA polymerase sigma factor n=1 Tax=Agaribacillus aureus TaxID=3051825 RepID=A0ABT8L5Y3_9BACT|nr:sigma-70 family RNA polymerase sigma factor [Fulvivirgaceae bacterium BMA12]
MFFKRGKKDHKTDHPTDDELVKIYQQHGDMVQLGKLYQRYTGLVFAVCMKYLKDEDDSKDAVMQIFEKLCVSLREHEVHNFKSWLHVLTKNHCLMWLRSQKNRHHKDIQEINLEKNVEFTYHPHHNNEEDLENLKAAILSLPAAQKQCIELFYLEEKCYKEIVAITGFELKKVKSYIQNGRRNLKIHMEKL